MVFPKKVLTIIIIGATTLLLVYFLFIRKGGGSADGKTSENGTVEARGVEETPLPVRVARARKAELVLSLNSPGEAVTDLEILMKSEVSGTIQNLNVRESQHVAKGDVLLEIDDRPYRLDLETSEADRLMNLSTYLLENKFAEERGTENPKKKPDLEKARRDFERSRDLFNKGVLSREDFDKAYRAYEIVLIESGEKRDEIRSAAKNLTQSEINVKRAQMNLDKTKVRAPFSGIVTDIKVSPGEQISSATELFTLVNISRIQVHAKVLESEIAKMKVGREVDLKFSAYPDRVFKGIVTAISPIINPDDRTCKVIISVDNPKEMIKPGMHADVEIAAEVFKNRLLVPQDAVLSRSGRKLIFVIENELAKWRYVEIGLENKHYAEILDGVNEGETVIVEGHFTLAHDAKVRIVD